jgi:hypothetical protein
MAISARARSAMLRPRSVATRDPVDAEVAPVAQRAHQTRSGSRRCRPASARPDPFENCLGDSDIPVVGLRRWHCDERAIGLAAAGICDSWIWLRPSVRGIRSFTSQEERHVADQA